MPMPNSCRNGKKGARNPGAYDEIRADLNTMTARLTSPNVSKTNALASFAIDPAPKSNTMSAMPAPVIKTPQVGVPKRLSFWKEDP